MPEAAVSITAALDNNAGVAIGNVVGSNIVNILLILGMTAAITSLRVYKATAGEREEVWIAKGWL